MTDTRLHRFLGGSPGSVIVKLVVISLIVGAAMVFLNVTPRDLLDNLRDTVQRLLGSGFENLRVLAAYIGYGAIVVVPIFLIVRLMKMRRPG